MRILSVFISAVLLCACNVHHPSEKQQLADAIRKKVAIELKNELGLIPVGTSGRMMYQIKILGLAFDYRKPLDIETGRELLVKAVEKFTKEVNTNKAIRPYLDNYPFVGAKNIEITIFIRDQNGKHFDLEGISILDAQEGVLKYENLQIPTLTTLYEETYEEALEKLKHKKQSAKLITP